MEQKRKLYQKEHETDGIEKIEVSDSTETQRKLTRSSISLKNFKPTFSFCDKDDSDMKLHLCQTFQFQRKIEEIADKISDTESLAKVSTSGMIAIEVKYHCKCPATYCNKARNEHPSTGMQQENEITTRIVNIPVY